MKVLSKSRLKEAFAMLAEGSELYVPLQKGEITGFFPWTKNETAELTLDVLNTCFPPKNVLLPQTEKMYAFRTEKEKVEIQEVFESKLNRVIFGIRACDLKAISALDKVFLTGFVDKFYEARRNNLTIIAQACYEPGKYCFCESMGVDPTNPEGADILLYDLGDEFGWEDRTDKGKDLTNRLAGILMEREFKKPDFKGFTARVDIEGLAEKLKTNFEHPVWEELAGKCMNCGICTYFCPGCYCFDIQVKTRGDKGYYFRCWDSCMYKEYNQMAGGHNPREDKKARFRNRFLHKLEFFQGKYGSPLCTGCGRCIVMCPNGVNIIKIIERLKEVN